MPRTAKPKPATTEPEVMGPADVAPAAADKRKPDPFLDPVRTHLSRTSGFEDHAEDIILDCYGRDDQAMPARMLAFLRRVKTDGRFYIEKRGTATIIGLSESEAAIAVGAPEPEDTSTIPAGSPAGETQEAQAAPPATAEAPTIADLLAATQAQPRFPYPAVKGMPVLLLTEGQDPAPARIVAVKDHGTTSTYDLLLADGPINDVPAHRLAPHPEAERVYADRELRYAALERHQKRAAELAQRYFGLQADEARKAKDLSDLRKLIDATATELAEHDRCDAVQTMLADILDNAAAKEAAKNDTRSEVQKRLDAGDVVEWADEYSLDDLMASALRRDTSTGKPPKLVPFEIMSGEPHVLVDVQDGVAVLLPAFTREAWIEAFGELHGEPVEPPSEVAGYCGYPVKVGRKVLHLGREADALLLRVPDGTAMPGAEPELAMSGKDAAAGA